MIAPFAVALATCTVTDGDTIRCGDERFRVLAVDAPELPGHYASNRTCVEGDPFASSMSLQDAIRDKQLTIERTGVDRYGKTLGVVYADGANLSCPQLEAGHAKYVGRYDTGKRVAKDCPDLVG